MLFANGKMCSFTYRQPNISVHRTIGMLCMLTKLSDCILSYLAGKKGCLPENNATIILGQEGFANNDWLTRSAKKNKSKTNIIWKGEK